MENFEKLRNVYNTLNLVETKGQSTVLIAACITTLKEMLEEIIQAAEAENDKNK